MSDFEDDDEPVIEETKEKKKKEKKTLVFEIKLSEDVNEKYEYNYKEMVKEHEERMKKVDSDIEIIEILDDDPVPKRRKSIRSLSTLIQKTSMTWTTTSSTTQRPMTKLCRTRCQQSMEGSTSTSAG